MAVAVKTTTTFEAGPAVALFERPAARIIDFDIAADGQSFMVNSAVTGPDTLPIHVVVNWMAGIKQ